MWSRRCDTAETCEMSRFWRVGCPKMLCVFHSFVASQAWKGLSNFPWVVGAPTLGNCLIRHQILFCFDKVGFSVLKKRTECCLYIYIYIIIQYIDIHTYIHVMDMIVRFPDLQVIRRLKCCITFCCAIASAIEEKLPAFKRLSHKDMQEMSVKNLPGTGFLRPSTQFATPAISNLLWDIFQFQMKTWNWNRAPKAFSEDHIGHWFQDMSSNYFRSMAEKDPKRV